MVSINQSFWDFGNTNEAFSRRLHDNLRHDFVTLSKHLQEGRAQSVGINRLVYNSPFSAEPSVWVHFWEMSLAQFKAIEAG